MNARLSDHAERRRTQRGIRRETVRLILSYADRRSSRPGDIECCWISRRRQRALAASGVSPQLLDKADGVALLLTRSDGAIVTVMHLCGSAGRAYRRRS